MLWLLILIKLFVASYGYEEIERRVVNGISAENYIPYQASIRVSVRDYLRFGRGHTCGAVFVNSRTVVTAAHCLMDGLIYRTPFDIHVVFGSLNRFTFTQETMIGYVEKIIVHPDYLRTQSFAHDIGVVILRRSIEFTDNITPIPLIDYQVDADTECQISGWGGLYWRGPMPAQLQKGNVTIFDRISCNSSDSYNGIITNGMICANGKTETGAIIDVCQGDSGGPLVCNNMLVGLASFGDQCGRLIHRPGVFVDIYYYRNWIIDHWNGVAMQKSHKISIFMFTLFVNLIWKFEL